jgi:Leucine-rich repeat (LRR) protein
MEARIGPFAERRILQAYFDSPGGNVGGVLSRSVARLLAALPFLALSLLAMPAPAGAAVPSAERNALKAIYNGTGGGHWLNRAAWLGAAGSECDWAGVRCNTARTTVTGLDLSDNGLTGKLPASLGNLANLQSLDLGGNSISGPLPSTVGKLAQLQALHLALNQISGPLPRELGALSKLQILDAPFNRLSGALPVEIGKLANLQILDLGGNQIAGTLPAQLGTLRSLFYLDLSGNRLTGAIPAALGTLAKLQTLYLDDNQLSGPIPAALGSLTALGALGLSGNQLTGRIPRELGNLANLMFLNLEMNQLGGAVPPELGNATSLIGLLLSANRLGGTVPGTFLNLVDLETLWLDHNRFAGPVPFELGALPTLDDNGGLDLRSNALATDTEPGLLADLNIKQVGGNWTRSQAAVAQLDPLIPLTGLADRRSSGLVVWTVQTLAGGPPLTVSTAGGTGDVDLYVRFGAPPTTALSDASSTHLGNAESVTVAAPKAGTYYIGLSVHSAYTGVTLRVGGGAR